MMSTVILLCSESDCIFCFSEGKVYICNRRDAILQWVAPCRHIRWKYFRFYPWREIWTISKRRDKQIIHHLVWRTVHSALFPYLVWSIVYLRLGPSRASLQINEMLHTFFIYTIPSGAGVQYITYITYITYEKVFGIIRLCSSFLCRL